MRVRAELDRCGDEAVEKGRGLLDDGGETDEELGATGAPVGGELAGAVAFIGAAADAGEQPHR